MEQQPLGFVIPKIIFQTSINKPEQYVVDKILSKCDGWRYIHFTDNDVLQFFNENPIEEFKNIIVKFNNMPRGQHKADLFRYYYLYINGGVFLDSDAMIEMNIEHAIGHCNFFSVNSSYKINSIFQGFIGAIPKHNIIYKALVDAYHINIEALRKNYHLLCYHLYDIILLYNNDRNIILFMEDHNDDNSASCLNENGETVVIHYWRYKQIPM